jgi:putative PIN family toxin of toxin-antitoxin system
LYRTLLKDHDLIRSGDLTQEIRRVLSVKMRMTHENVKAAMDEFEVAAQLLAPLPVPDSACRDPRDIHVLGLAAAGHAGLLVTGDKDLLVLKSFRGIRIVNPGMAFRELIGAPPAPPAYPSTPTGGVSAAERRRRYDRRAHRVSRRIRRRKRRSKRL